MAQIILELIFGPVDFGLQVGLVAVQGGGAEAIFLAEGGRVADPATKA